MAPIVFLFIVIAVAWAIWTLISNTEEGNTPKQLSSPKRAKKEYSIRTPNPPRSTNPPRTANSIDGDYQKWLTKAVKYKKDKDFDQAIECLDKAYRLCAGYPLETVFDNYLRLPAYLQAAGRADEGWGELNKLNIGVCPYRGD